MATWKVISMGTGKLRMITSEVQRYGISYGISVLGIAEHRCVGQRHFKHAAVGTVLLRWGERRFVWSSYIFGQRNRGNYFSL